MSYDVFGLKSERRYIDVVVFTLLNIYVIHYNMISMNRHFYFLLNSKCLIKL
jgi:hypothetical protein